MHHTQAEVPLPPPSAPNGMFVRGEAPAPVGIPGGRNALSPPVPFPPESLDRFETAHIVYACNLPGKGAPAAGSDIFANRIEPGLEFEFLANTLPGGQVAIFPHSQKSGLLRIRWLCLTENSSIGSVWRCFLQARLGSKPKHWIALDHDYLFDAEGYALN